MIRTIDITVEQRTLLTGLLSEHLPSIVVWAYGSRVKQTARAYSDLDLVVFASVGQSSAVSELKEALDESNLPFLVDLHVWDELPESFHELIRMEHVVLHDGSQSNGRSQSSPDKPNATDCQSPPIR